MSSDHDDDEPYEVGYKKPPKSTRFKPGTSGNPKGRKARSTTVKGKLQERLHMKLNLTDGSTSTPMDIIIAKAVQEMAVGNIGKWVPTLQFLSEFDPKQKFKPTADDEQRLNQIIADAIIQGGSDGEE